MTGLEPANNGTTNHRRNHLATPAYNYLTIKIKTNIIIKVFILLIFIS